VVGGLIPYAGVLFGNLVETLGKLNFTLGKLYHLGSNRAALSPPSYVQIHRHGAWLVNV